MLKNIFVGVGVLFLTLSSFAQTPELHRREFLNEIQVPVASSVKVAFFDADSTLRISKIGKTWANDPQDYIILPGVPQAIRKLNEEGYLVAIVSNQRAAVAAGVPLVEVDQAMYNMIQDLRKEGAVISYYDYAENRDENRKPGTGMAKRLEEKLKERFGSYTYIDKPQSFMVGDSGWGRASEEKPADTRPDGRPGFSMSNNDRLFAENYGIRHFEPQYYYNWIAYGTEIVETTAHLDALLKAMASGCKGTLAPAK